MWVDSNEAGTLLVSLRPHAFDEFELLPVDEGTVLLSPLCNTPCPAYIKTCYMPRKDDNNSLGSVNVIKHTKSSKNLNKKVEIWLRLGCLILEVSVSQWLMTRERAQ